MTPFPVPDISGDQSHFGQLEMSREWHAAAGTSLVAEKEMSLWAEGRAYAYRNGPFALGAVLRSAGDYYGRLGRKRYDAGYTFAAWFDYFGESMFNTLGNGLTPATYGDGAENFGARLGSVYVNSDGDAWLTTQYGLTSWNVGAIVAGIEGQDPVTLHEFDGYERALSINSGVVGTATVVLGGAELSSATGLTAKLESFFPKGPATETLGGNSVFYVTTAEDITFGSGGRTFNFADFADEVANIRARSLASYGPGEGIVAQAAESETYLFRGTTPGFPGRYGVSPTSTSPGVATHFGVEAGTAGGVEGVVYVIPRSAVAGKVLPPQLNALAYEFEVPLDIAPLNIPSVSVRAIPASQARSILQGIGYEVPSVIYGPERLTPLLKTAPTMTPAQTAAFLKALGL